VKIKSFDFNYHLISSIVSYNFNTLRCYIRDLYCRNLGSELYPHPRHCAITLKLFTYIGLGLEGLAYHYKLLGLYSAHYSYGSWIPCLSNRPNIWPLTHVYPSPPLALSFSYMYLLWVKCFQPKLWCASPKLKVQVTCTCYDFYEESVFNICRRIALTESRIVFPPYPTSTLHVSHLYLLSYWLRESR